MEARLPSDSGVSLIDLTKGFNALFIVFIPPGWFKADLGLWKPFLDDFNGRSFVLADNWLPSNVLNLYTDAAAGCCFGAIFGIFCVLVLCLRNGKMSTLLF